LVRRHVGQIDVDHVGERDLGYVALAASRCVLVGDIAGERCFSLSTVARAEASAMLASAVSDDPDCGIAAAVVAWSRRTEP
jgi:hypothetical protein